MKLWDLIVLFFDSPWVPPEGTKKGGGIETFCEHQRFCHVAANAVAVTAAAGGIITLEKVLPNKFVHSR